jgi:glycosyltransferase involved in cell wall biosynthesis
MRRLAVIASHPVQYQVPLFRALAREVDLEVFFCHRQDPAGQAEAGFGVEFDWDVPVLHGYRHGWLTNVARVPDVSRFSGCDTPEIGRRLASGGFDACLVNGWYLKSYLQAMRACWKRGVPVFVRGDSQLRTPRSRAKSAVKYLPYRWLLNRIEVHLYVGAANRAYLESYGVPSSKLFFAPHFADNDFFSDGAERARRSGLRDELRRHWGFASQATVFALVGKLIEKKRPHDFVDALARLRSNGNRQAAGLIVGSGAMQSEIEAHAARQRVPVAFAGFRNQTELPSCYAAADALVLPSDGRETWGLVVNEALACGVPVVVSDAAGCAADFAGATPAVTSFPVGDVEALARAMAQMHEALAADRRGVMDAARAVVRGYTPGHACAAVLRGLESVSGREVPCPAA